MRFMMLMIPSGYQGAARGTFPDVKAVEWSVQKAVTGLEDAAQTRGS